MFLGEYPLRILISGASGLVGSALSEFLRQQNHKVVSLVRRPVANIDNEILWKPSEDWLDPASIENFDAIVHLAGENIADKRWNDERKRLIVESRVKPTALLARCIERLSKPPKVFITASAIGFYGSRAAQELSESSSAGQGFLATTTQQWEAAAQPIATSSTRLVVARLGVVLSPTGGALAKMLPFFRAGIGGVVASGEQFLSWIVLDDLIAALYFLLQRDDLSGVFNLVSPKPSTNREFTQALAKVLNRPAVIPVPKFAINALYGEMGEATALASVRVLPKRLLESGFAFKYEDLAAGLSHLLK